MMSTRWSIALALALALAPASCKGRSDEAARSAEQAPAEPASVAPEEAALAEQKEALATEIAALEAEGKLDKLGGAKKRRSASKSAEADADDAEGGLPGRGGAERGPKMRAWFPETFLFEPLVVTDAQGTAEVEVRVPDRLTTWRVLGLAHSRGGAQAGAVASFLGTLPAYVDPVVPSLLRAGDQVRVPIQLVNTTAEAITTTLALEVSGAELTGPASRPVTLAPRQSRVEHATVRANEPGQVRLLARLGDDDAVVRTAEVRPTGRPVTQTRSGTLAQPRTFEITDKSGGESGGESGDKSAGAGRARLMVFPGALAILRSELAVATDRTAMADDAFSLLTAGQAPALLRAFGDQPDPDALRRLTLLATQRMVRHARVLDMASAPLLAQAALAHADNPVLARLGQRAVQYIQRHQTPDGTCGGDQGWPLQRLLVATAECARAAQVASASASAPTVVIRASGAFERHAEHIRDPYTAAAVLASGAAADHLADRLRAIVLEAVYERPDGSRAVAVPDSPHSVARADGARPSDVEATALAILALRGHADAPLADMAATVLAAYSPRAGWGDGRANLACMQATAEMFKDPIPDRVTITLSRDGQVVAQGALTRDRVREVLVLEADGLSTAPANAPAASPDRDPAAGHTWQVRAEPAVPGLGFALSLTRFVPWTRPSEPRGLELAVTPPRSPRVGQPADLGVRALVPAGRAFRVHLALPAGVQVDATSLDALVREGALTRYQLGDGTLELVPTPLAAAHAFQAAVRVIPTLAGTLHSGAATLELTDGGPDATFHEPPIAWMIAP